MTDFKINDYILQQEAKRLAQECLDEHDTLDSLLEPSELLWNKCLGHEWSIYTYKALLLCAECDTSEGEDYLEGLDMQHDSFSDHAFDVAFYTLYCAALNALEELQQET
tara:strand:- start:204 stop:530 length:327 start_codon:yes stop_codon:yes gene_type:complete